MIEVWRPGRPEGQRSREGQRPRPQRDARPRREPRRPRPAPQAAANGVPASAEGVAAASAEGVAAVEGAPATDAQALGRAKPWRRRDDRKDAVPNSAMASGRRRSSRPWRASAASGSVRASAARRTQRRAVRIVATVVRRAATAPIAIRIAREIHQGPRGREVAEAGTAAVDVTSSSPIPNSPFAKLAALKAQLESNKDSTEHGSEPGRPVAGLVPAHHIRLHWIGSASTNGCGTRGWCAPAPPPPRSPNRATFGSTASASMPQAARCAWVTSSPSHSTGPCACSRSSGFAERRGSADDARGICEDLTPVPEPAEPEPAPVAERERGAGRPTKRERRAMGRFMERLPERKISSRIGGHLAVASLAGPVPVRYSAPQDWSL